MLELYHRLSHIGAELNGSLSFVQDWSFFVPTPQHSLESLVPVGPYAGTLSAFATGTKLRTRYAHLLEHAQANNQTSFWASGSKRVIDTARYFGAGFFGIDWQAEGRARLHVIPETNDRGADTLTPGDTCKNYVENVDEFGHDYGYRKVREWQLVYLPAIVRRLNDENPALMTTAAEVYVMQEICGFETLAKGQSDWCSVFSHEEMEKFEYARDVLHFYRSGPGNRYAAGMGWLWLNASTSLLMEDLDKGVLFFTL